MKKVMFIMAAALLMMTQCKKENETPNGPAEGTVKMTVTAGSGAKTDISTETGAITWSAGDKLYVSDGTNWLGSLTLIDGADESCGTFSGNVAIGGGTTPCHFFYLGNSGMTEPTAGTSTDAVISLASQDGTLAGAMKYHIGYGRTDVTVESGECEGYVVMNTKIAIAHINFTTDGTTAYTGSVTMGGTGISNTLSVSPDGSFSGSGSDGIAIGNGGGTTGERYVTLIPTGETSIFVAFTGDATGGMAFANGIVENKFYGMKDALAVTLEAAAPKFTVGENTTVEFAPGNLYWDGSAFHFEANQWSFESSWNASHVSHFFWSKDASVACAGTYSESGTTETDVFFTNVDGFTVNVGGAEQTGWRTLSTNEWQYLFNTRTVNGGQGAGKSYSLNITYGGKMGLVLYPDDYDKDPVTGTVTNLPDGVVFLPAAGYRNGSSVSRVGDFGRYWSSTALEGDNAYDVYCLSNFVDPFDYDDRSIGFSVRLVR